MPTKKQNPVSKIKVVLSYDACEYLSQSKWADAADRKAFRAALRGDKEYLPVRIDPVSAQLLSSDLTHALLSGEVADEDFELIEEITEALESAG